jgi:hypothetical protein
VLSENNKFRDKTDFWKISGFGHDQVDLVRLVNDKHPSLLGIFVTECGENKLDCLSFLSLQVSRKSADNP